MTPPISLSLHTLSHTHAHTHIHTQAHTINWNIYILNCPRKLFLAHTIQLRNAGEINLTEILKSFILPNFSGMFITIVHTQLMPFHLWSLNRQYSNVTKCYVQMLCSVKILFILSSLLPRYSWYVHFTFSLLFMAYARPQTN